MSPRTAVSLERVSKRFTIYHRHASGLKERLIGAAARNRDAHEDLWALKEVTLDVAAGETLGLIGPNGCGKSTLLQIVAGILVPDGGTARVTGRVTSLLELGAGFSPELSGRENVFLNASLHGVPREVAARKFDDIIGFAELERFVDTPVRNYSSGMYVRLGFAVAIHLDPEVLLVDEAFAVGDEAFQRKCLQVMRRFQRDGVTMLVVSHDLRLIEQVAGRACLLDRGSLIADGPPASVIARYHELGAARGHVGPGGRWGTGDIQITGIDIVTREGTRRDVARTRDPVTLRLHYRAGRVVERPVFGIAIHQEDGAQITGPNTRMSGVDIPAVEGEGAVEYDIERLPLLPGRYLISAAVYDHDLITPFDHRDRFKVLTVVEGGTEERFGFIEIQARWRVAEVRVAP